MMGRKLRFHKLNYLQKTETKQSVKKIERNSKKVLTEEREQNLHLKRTILDSKIFENSLCFLCSFAKYLNLSRLLQPVKKDSFLLHIEVHSD